MSLLALLATQEALAMAGISLRVVSQRHDRYALEQINTNRTGVFIGTGIGGAKTFLENHAFQILHYPAKSLRSIQQAGFTYPNRANRMAVSMLMPNAVSASIGIKYGLHGRNRTVTNACAAGTSAIGEAWYEIATGNLDMAICGGAEYLYDDYGTIYRGFDMLGTLAKPTDNIQYANRPFDKQRSGFLYAQGGAGILILESIEHAQQRQAGVLGHISGFAETFDAQSMVALAEDGMQIERAIRGALAIAKRTSGDVDYINAHGTGTEANDRVEAEVIGRTFPQRPKVASNKSVLGHTIGASGALEAIITLLSMQQQQTPACLNLDEPDFGLNFVTNSQERFPINTALSCSYAFGGHNAALVLSTC